jgi:hypothetical protein
MNIPNQIPGYLRSGLNPTRNALIGMHGAESRREMVGII